jgi:hypothetical protein
MSAIDAAKELASLIKKVGDVDLYQKIVALQGEVVALSTRTFESEKKCVELQAALNLKKSLKHVRLLYFIDGDPIPFCPLCYDGGEKLIHLFGPTKAFDPKSKVEGWECGICFHNYHANPNENFRASVDRYRMNMSHP